MSLLSRPSSEIKRRRVTRTLFSLTCAFAICWLPIHTLELLNCKRMLDTFYDNYPSLLDTSRAIAHALSYFNSCLNPVLYALINREFFL
jgi:galanin receptor 2